MKNVLKICLAITLLCSISTAHAQQFEWGVKGGLNMSNFINSPFTSEAKPSFHAGLQVQYLFTENLGIESGLYYSVMKVKSTYEYEYIVDPNWGNYSGAKPGFEATTNPAYLQLPVQALYKFRLGEKFSLYPAAGIYLGYGIAGKNDIIHYSVDEKGERTSESDSYDYFNDTVNKFDMGLSFGLSLQYDKITFGLGYDRGLTNVYKKGTQGVYPDGTYVTDSNIYNDNIKVSLGYLF